MNRIAISTLFLVLCLSTLALPAAGDVEIPVRFPPGDFRVALPSPDGTRLAVIGGSGDPGREHVVMILWTACGEDSARAISVSGSAKLAEVPEGVPRAPVVLQWSPDGDRLFAAGVVYRIGEKDGALTAEEIRRVPKPMLDFRFGPGEIAAGVAVEKAQVREVKAGREALVIKLEYAVYRLDRDLVTPIEPREKYGRYWIPDDWDEPPALQYEDDGALLIFYPYQRVTERFVAGKQRDALGKDFRPEPRAEPGSGPFEFEKPCRTAWRLGLDAPGDRVVLGK